MNWFDKADESIFLFFACFFYEGCDSIVNLRSSLFQKDEKETHYVEEFVSGAVAEGWKSCGVRREKILQ